MDRTDVSNVGFGRRPDKRTTISNDHISKLHIEKSLTLLIKMTNYCTETTIVLSIRKLKCLYIVVDLLLWNIKNNEANKLRSQMYQTITAEGIASLRKVRMFCKASFENPVHVFEHEGENLT